MDWRVNDGISEYGATTHKKGGLGVVWGVWSKRVYALGEWKRKLCIPGLGLALTTDYAGLASGTNAV